MSDGFVGQQDGRFSIQMLCHDETKRWHTN